MIKNKMKILLGAVLTATLLVAGCTSLQQKDTTTKKEYTHIKDNYFLVRDGKIIETKEEPTEQKNILDWYFDPACPSCTKLDGLMKQHIADLSSKLTIRYHAMGFLSTKSLDRYSNRASAFILSVVENDPEHGLDFYHAVLNEDFRPKRGEDSLTPDETFEKIYKDIGGKVEWSKIKETQNDTLNMVEDQTAIAFNTKKLTDKAKDGRLIVPFLIVGDSQYAINFLESLDVEKQILDTVENYVNPSKNDIKENEESTDNQATEATPDKEKESTDKEQTASTTEKQVEKASSEKPADKAPSAEKPADKEPAK